MSFYFEIKRVTGKALLVHNGHHLSRTVFSFIIFLKLMKPNDEHQVLNGRLIKVTFFSDNKGSTFVGMAKRWPQLLNRGCCLINNK